MSVIRDYIHPTIGCRIIVRDDDVAGEEEQKLLRRQLMRIGCDISRRVWREEQQKGSEAAQSFNSCPREGATVRRLASYDPTRYAKEMEVKTCST